MYGCGTVFKLAHKGSGWVFTPLYNFQGGNDGAAPGARVIFGPDGTLYGTTTNGGVGPCRGDGGETGCGTVFNVRPSPRACTTALCPWTETVLYRFTGGSDGSNPGSGDLLFDQSGNLYGTTYSGGAYGLGAVFSLSPSNGGWSESVLYSFTGGNDGSRPQSSVIFDQSGNLYGTTIYGGPSNLGVVYELTNFGSGWQEKTIYSFPGTVHGQYPVGGLILDGSGNLYGTTQSTTASQWGLVYELTPSNGNWTITHTANLPGDSASSGPVASLIMDAGGNLYGAVPREGSTDTGIVFEVSNWRLIGLWDFNYYQYSDGYFPYGSVILDANGNLYGTTEEGGANQAGYGVIWEIKP